MVDNIRWKRVCGGKDCVDSILELRLAADLQGNLAVARRHRQRPRQRNCGRSRRQVRDDNRGTDRQCERRESNRSTCIRNKQFRAGSKRNRAIARD